MRTQREEFPALTPEAKECFVAAHKAAFPLLEGYEYDCSEYVRKGQAAFLREAMKQAVAVGTPGSWWLELKAIADNLHGPPPPPPTLAQARAADLDSPAGRDVVRDSLATLGEGVQP